MLRTWLLEIQLCSVRVKRHLQKAIETMPSVIFFFNFFFPGGVGEVLGDYGDPDTLTKCLKVRWAECRQLFRSLVVKAFGMAAYAVLANRPR